MTCAPAASGWRSPRIRCTTKTSSVRSSKLIRSARGPTGRRRTLKRATAGPAYLNSTHTRDKCMNEKLFRLDGKVAIVTGSTKGIGKAMARGLAAAGALVVVSSRKQDLCDEVAAELQDE